MAGPRTRIATAFGPAGPPLGAAAWQETRLLLPDVDPAWRWSHVFTGERLAPIESEGRLALAAADVFAHFPVALLVAG